LLVPSWTASGEERRFQDISKLMDRVARRVGLEKGALRSRLFRHTYCAARLQTLDRGAPVSFYTVSRELGHGSEDSEDMVRRVYSHLGEVRHRSEVVEFRLEQHLERLGDRLQRLGLQGPFVTGNVTGGEPSIETQSPAPTKVEAGEALPESGRPDSNRRRPAWEAGILPLNYARGSSEMLERPPGESSRTTSPPRPPGSSSDPARSPPARREIRCPAAPPASTAPTRPPGRRDGRTSPR
jgi:hypothetical protein